VLLPQLLSTASSLSASVYVPTGVVDLREIAAPAAPPAGHARLYAKADGLLYSKDDAGVETALGSSGGGGGAVAPSAPDAPDLGYKAWTYDPASALVAGNVPTGGVLQLARIWTRSAITVDRVYLMVVTAGATLTNVGVALYSTAGTLLTSSVNANGATTALFQATGQKTVTFPAAQSIAAGSFYVGFWTTGTTQPAYGVASGKVNVNGQLTAPNFRFAVSTTALTTTAPNPFGTQTQLANSYWVAAA